MAHQKDTTTTLSQPTPSQSGVSPQYIEKTPKSQKQELEQNTSAKSKSTDVVKPVSSTPTGESGKRIYSSSELEGALYNVTDILQRCLVPFVLLGDTAKSVHYGPEILEPTDGVYIGVEKKHMTPEVWSNLRTFSKNTALKFLTLMEDYHELPGGFKWRFNKIPIYVRVIEDQYEFFKHVDTKFFRLEEYAIPNPFKAYWEKRFEIK